MPQLSSLQSASPPADRLPPGTFTVAAILQIAGRALSQVLPADCWICGEVADYKDKPDKSGHHYFKLVEPVRGGTPKKLECAIWDSTMTYVQRQLTAAGISIANGQKMLFRGQVKFYDGGGKLTFHVREVSAEYTLGDIEKRRREILARLKAEGLDQKNKRQVLPELPLRICLLSSRNADGRDDFLQIVRKSGYAFDVQAADIPVQGPTLAAALCSTLKMLAAKQSILNFDAICIVRGGGSSTDLDWWNNYEICAAIARMPLPVVIGIGHHRNRVAVDEVAHQSLGTPTAAAQFFCNKVKEQDERLQALRCEICQLAKTAIDAQAHAIASNRTQIATLSTAAVEREKTEAAGLQKQVRTLATAAIEMEKTRATSLRTQFLSQVASLVRSEKNTLHQRRQSLKNARSATLRATGQVVKLRDLLAAEGRRLLQSQQGRIERHRTDSAQAADRLMDAETDSFSLLIQAIRREPHKLVAAESQHVGQQEKLVTAYDPINNLRRGYSITRDAAGNIVRTIDAVAAGAEITTQLADGHVRSVVAEPTRPGEE